MNIDLWKKKDTIISVLSHRADFGHVRYKKCIYCHIDVNFVATFALEKTDTIISVLSHIGNFGHVRYTQKIYYIHIYVNFVVTLI